MTTYFQLPTIVLYYDGPILRDTNERVYQMSYNAIYDYSSRILEFSYDPNTNHIYHHASGQYYGVIFLPEPRYHIIPGEELIPYEELREEQPSELPAAIPEDTIVRKPVNPLKHYVVDGMNLSLEIYTQYCVTNGINTKSRFVKCKDINKVYTDMCDYLKTLLGEDENNRLHFVLKDDGIDFDSCRHFFEKYMRKRNGQPDNRVAMYKSAHVGKKEDLSFKECDDRTVIFLAYNFYKEGGEAHIVSNDRYRDVIRNVDTSYNQILPKICPSVNFLITAEIVKVLRCHVKKLYFTWNSSKKLEFSEKVCK